MFYTSWFLLFFKLQWRVQCTLITLTFSVIKIKVSCSVKKIPRKSSIKIWFMNHANLGKINKNTLKDQLFIVNLWPRLITAPLRQMILAGWNHLVQCHTAHGRTAGYWLQLLWLSQLSVFVYLMVFIMQNSAASKDTTATDKLTKKN